MKRITAWTLVGLAGSYLVVVHLLLAYAVTGTDFVTRLSERFGVLPPEIHRFHQGMVAFHRRIDENLESGHTLFIGDSHIQGLAVNLVVDNAVNYGIGADTTVGVLDRIGAYRSLAGAKHLVLAIGYNDLKRRDPVQILANLRLILERVPGNVNTLLCGLIPVDEVISGKPGVNARIERVNAGYRTLAGEYANVSYLPPPVAAEGGAGIHEDDGVHLNRAGKALWIESLRRRLQT